MPPFKNTECCIPAGRGSIQQGSVRLTPGDVGVPSYTGTQSVENTMWGIQRFMTIIDEYKNGIKRGSVLRLKGVGEMDMVNG